jgi:NAD+ kinase
MKIYVFCNQKDRSRDAYNEFIPIVKEFGYEPVKEFTGDEDLLACIGGDGTFLSFVHKCGFPKVPIIGINTGHLGFFQEALPTNMRETIEYISAGNYQIQNISPVQARIVTRRGDFMRTGLNEIVVRGPFSHASHYEVSIDNTKIQDFSGDGIIISTPVGSTAYNYSLGGSLISPELDVLQLTPIAPMSTSAYRCFNSSLILPSRDTITIAGTGRCEGGTVMVSFDGRTHEFGGVQRIEVTRSDKEIHLIRMSSYDHWSKLSSKLL